MPELDPETRAGTSLDKMSLRRALWRARVVAQTLDDRAALQEPERSATLLLRKNVKAQLQETPYAEIAGCPVYRVEADWQSEVLRRDPEIVCAGSDCDLADMLDAPEPLAVMALRESAVTIERLRALCPAGMRGKTVFVEV